MKKTKRGRTVGQLGTSNATRGKGGKKKGTQINPNYEGTRGKCWLNIQGKFATGGGGMNRRKSKDILGRR